MGPPREHGGMLETGVRVGCARDGFNGAAARTRRNANSSYLGCQPKKKLQWGRRANTAEWRPAGLEGYRGRAGRIAMGV